MAGCNALPSAGDVARTEQASLEIGEAGLRFEPTFVVLYRDTQPKLRLDHVPEAAYRAPGWQIRDGEPYTVDLFAVGERVTMTATQTVRHGDGLRFLFPEHERFTLSATLKPSSSGPPVLTFTFTPHREGWYSVGYVGAPATLPEDARAIWQPLVWQEKRMPKRSYLSTEFMCSLPATLVETETGTYGVAADTSEIPFRMATFSTSRFGVALRNPDGLAQPMIFAPVLGLPDSHMKPEEPYTFRCRLFADRGDWFTTVKRLARELYDYRDYRRNGSCSLNETIANMIDFAMNDTYSGWKAEYKAFDYFTDVADSVKLVSALHPLSVAMITDDAEIYRRRAAPMIEYMMSREKYLFAARPDVKGQSASYRMNGPCAEIGELAGLYAMSGGRTFAFRKAAQELYGKPRALNLDMISPGATWQDALALYRMTGDAGYLEKATSSAAAYIAERITTPQADFADVHVERGGQFWTDFAPKWVDLLELYEETRDPRFLEGAVAGARQFAMYTWMQPAVPDAMVTVHRGNHLATTEHMHGIPRPEPMEAAEQQVPAWRVSQVGLTPEASTTFSPNPAVLLTHYAAYMLRLAHYADEPFFREIARNAVVGRYANYPGYDINREYAMIYQRPDYPLRPWHELTYNQMYYNHVWPHIALLVDYLVSDVLVRSGGAIAFPSQYAPGYAYLQSKVYGDRPGQFYDFAGARLWMPRHLLRLDHVQINTLTAYTDDALCIALTNESSEPVEVTVTLNPEIVPVDVSRAYRVHVWQDNRPAGEMELRDGRLRVHVAGRGITGLIIDGLRPLPRFQPRLRDGEPLSERSYTVTTWDGGRITAMLLSFGQDLTHAYIWLDADETVLRAATFKWRIGNGKEQQATDARYPFEWSIPLPAKASEITCDISGESPTGARIGPARVHLAR